jgi:CheY-like chemotaxis protein
MTAQSILIVEDEGLIALHITEILENEGYRIIGPVCSGTDALRLIRHSQNIDLILMDIQLPGPIDGIETARRVKLHCLIPLIFITAHNSERMIRRMKEVHPDGIIYKPFDEKKVLTLIAETIDNHAGKILM